MRITIDRLQTILSVVGEEDSIGFDQDRGVQIALATIQNKIDAKVNSGELALTDCLLTFE